MSLDVACCCSHCSLIARGVGPFVAHVLPSLGRTDLALMEQDRREREKGDGSANHKKKSITLLVGRCFKSQRKLPLGMQYNSAVRGRLWLASYRAVRFKWPTKNAAVLHAILYRGAGIALIPLYYSQCRYIRKSLPLSYPYVFILCMLFRVSCRRSRNRTAFVVHTFV